MNCSHTNTFSVSAKCSDCCTITHPDGTMTHGYVPRDLGIGGGDYAKLTICIDCAAVVNLPLPPQLRDRLQAVQEEATAEMARAAQAREVALNSWGGD